MFRHPNYVPDLSRLCPPDLDDIPLVCPHCGDDGISVVFSPISRKQVVMPHTGERLYHCAECSTEEWQ